MGSEPVKVSLNTFICVRMTDVINVMSLYINEYVFESNFPRFARSKAPPRRSPLRRPAPFWPEEKGLSLQRERRWVKERGRFFSLFTSGTLVAAFAW